METLYKIILGIHVCFGFTALTTGIVPMAAKKGGKVHNTWGMIYYWAMFGVFVTTLVLFALKPMEVKLQFFVGVAVFSFYNTFTGRQLVKMKKTGIQPKPIDWIAARLVFGFAFFMFFYGVWAFYKAQSITLTVALFMIFGIASFIFGKNDLDLYGGKKQPEKMHWIFGHISRMMGSYAATTTAFCVNVVPRAFPENSPMIAYLAVWVMPGLLVGFVIRYFTRQYRVKFKMPIRKGFFGKMEVVQK